MNRVLAFVVGSGLVVAMSALPQSQATFSQTTQNAGNSFAAKSVFPSVRVTTYELRPGAMAGTTFTLVLQQDLSADYFVIMRGGSGDGTSGGGRGPDDNYARISGDPHGNLSFTTASDELRIERRGTTGDWQGQVTVVEAVRDPLGSSFQLRDVVVTTMASGVTSASSASAGWTDINQVGLYGGNYGGGLDSTNVALPGHQSGWAQIWPSGGATVNLQRQSGMGGNLNGTSRFTTYVVEWGSEWNIQRVTVAGNNGGDGVDETGEYDTAAIGAVNRANTFILAYGRSLGTGTGDGVAGSVFTLGNGVTQSAVETVVAVGSEYNDARMSEVYVHTHPDLRVDYRFGTDGGSGIAAAATSGTMAVDPSVEIETFDTTGTVFETGDSRLSVVSNSSDGFGFEYPRSFVWARQSGGSQVTWTRSRSGDPGAFWLQSGDFALIGP